MAKALASIQPDLTIVRGSAAGQAVTAALILASVDEGGLWRKHLTDADANISMGALKYLTDRRDGKAVEYKKHEDVSQRSPDERIADILERANIRSASAAN